MNLLKYNSWAVVIKDINKPYKIFKYLKDKGYNLVVISEKSGNIDGIKVYDSLKDVPHNIDVVGILDESISLYTVLEEMELLDINNIWFEKNSYNEEIIKKAKSIKLNIEYNLNE